jgi:hypothetical protein
MLLGKATRNSDEVDAEDLVRAKERAFTARGLDARHRADPETPAAGSPWFYWN